MQPEDDLFMTFYQEFIEGRPQDEPSYQKRNIEIPLMQNYLLVFVEQEQLARNS